MSNQNQEKNFQVFPLTQERWSDFEDLFGVKGAFAGCWCMYWRMTSSEFNKLPGEQRKARMQALVNSGTIPGLLLYDGSTPIGWCSLGPRESFPHLVKSKTIIPIDDQPGWSIVCFYIQKKYRRQGVMEALINGAVAFSKTQEARILEAYPTDMQSEIMTGKKLSGYHGYMGIASAFRRAGFIEVGRVNDVQSIMRYAIS